MPLIPIQVPNAPAPKKDTLDKLTQAFGIAQSIVGTGFSIPEFFQKRQLQKEQIETLKSERELTPYKKIKSIGEALQYVEKVPANTPNAIEAGGSWFIPKPKGPEDEESKSDLGISRQIKRDAENGYLWVARPNKYGITEPEKVKEDQLTDQDKMNVITSGAAWRMRAGEAGANAKAFQTIFGMGQFGFQMGEADRRRFNEQADDIQERTTKVRDKYKEPLAKAVLTQKLLNSGNKVGTNMALTNMARDVAREKGPLNEGDVKRIFPSWASGEVASFMNWMTGDNRTTLSQNQLNDLNKMVSDWVVNTRKEYSDVMSDDLDLYEVRYPDAFSDNRVQKYVRTLEQQNPDLAAERTIRQLERKKATSTTQDIQRIDAMIAKLRSARGY